MLAFLSIETFLAVVDMAILKLAISYLRSLISLESSALGGDTSSSPQYHSLQNKSESPKPPTVLPLHLFSLLLNLTLQRLL